MKSVAQTVIEADHYYTIAAHTGNVIQAVEDAKNGGTVRLGKYEHKPEQEWSFLRVGDGVYRIRNRASGKLLDLMMTGTANGTWLHLWEDVGGTSQMWTVQPTPEGTVRLRSSWASGKCMDTVGMGAEVGTVLQIWQEVPGADQLWTIAEVKDRAKRAAKKEEAPAAETVEAVETVEAAPAVEAAPVVEAPAAKQPKAEEPAAPAVEEAPVVTEAPAAEPEKAEAPAAAPVAEEKAPEAPAAEPAVKEEPAAAAPATKAAPAAKPARKQPAKKTSRKKRK